MPRLDLRRGLRFTARVIAWLVGGLLLLVGAWVLSNLHDIDPVPRPAALALPAPSVADEANAFFALVGLQAAADRDPAAAGKASWLAELAHAARWRPPIEPTAAVQRDREDQAAMGVRLPGPAGPPLVCNSDSRHCAQAWIDQADKLAVQRQALATTGQRCEALLGESFRFEERLGPMQSVIEPIARHASPAATCSRWLQSGAVLAWARGRPADALALLVKADRLNRGLLAGSHSLIGQVIALRLAHDTQLTIATLALRDRAMAVPLATLLAPPPDPVQAVRRWIATEAAFQRGMMADASRTCLSVADVVDKDQLSWWQAREGQITSLVCRHHIGLHPERTLAALDGVWLRKFAALDAGLPAAILRLSADRKAANDTGLLVLLTWRNPFGNLLISVAEPGYDSYLARHADLELQRETALLAMQAVSIAAPERTAWTARQTLSPLAQGRLSWDTEGDTLSARPWQQDLAGGMHFNAERAIRFTLPKP